MTDENISELTRLSNKNKHGQLSEQDSTSQRKSPIRSSLNRIKKSFDKSRKSPNHENIIPDEGSSSQEKADFVSPTINPQESSDYPTDHSIAMRISNQSHLSVSKLDYDRALSLDIALEASKDIENEMQKKFSRHKSLSLKSKSNSLIRQQNQSFSRSLNHSPRTTPTNHNKEQQNQHKSKKLPLRSETLSQSQSKPPTPTNKKQQQQEDVKINIINTQNEIKPQSDQHSVEQQSLISGVKEYYDGDDEDEQPRSIDETDEIQHRHTHIHIHGLNSKKRPTVGFKGIDDDVRVSAHSQSSNRRLVPVFNSLRKSIGHFPNLLSDNSWMNTWTLKFPNSQLEYHFKSYFAHRILLSNQTAFLMLSLFYIIILFIFNVQHKYAWISILIHSIFIVCVFIGLVLTYTEQFREYIHKITVILVFFLMCGLTIQASLAEIPLSSETLMSILMVMLGMTAFLSIRYYHTIVMFCVFLVSSNIAFILMMLFWTDLTKNNISSKNINTQNIKMSHFIWFDTLLIFSQICSAHLIKRFEIQERKMFLKVLQHINQTKWHLHRGLTLFETANIQKLIEEDQEAGNHEVFPAFLKHMNHLGAILSHLPKWPDSETISRDNKTKSPTPTNQTKIEDINNENLNKLEIEDEDDDIELQYSEYKEEKEEKENEKIKDTPLELHFSPTHSITDSDNEDSDISIELSKMKNSPKLCLATELPDYYNAYPYLPCGYRLNYDYNMAVKSICEWHNETVNMWTEIIPLIINIFYLIIWTNAGKTWQKLSIVDSLFFMICAIFILVIRPICSTLAHTFYLISKKAHSFWWKIDYLSICLTMLCEGIITANYTFLCEDELRIFFFTCVSSMFVSTIFSTVMHHSGQIRAASFSLFAVFATGLPFIYQWASYLQHIELYHPLLDYLILWTTAYIVAVMALTVKSVWFPERCCGDSKKELLAYFGASHQLWHVLINISLFISVWTWTLFLNWKYDTDTHCPQ